MGCGLYELSRREKRRREAFPGVKDDCPPNCGMCEHYNMYADPWSGKECRIRGLLLERWEKMEKA